MNRTKDSGEEQGTFLDNSVKILNKLKALLVRVDIGVPFAVDADSAVSKMLSNTVGGLTKVV